MKPLALVLAAVFFIVALLYLFGVLQIGTHVDPLAPHKRHISHFVLFAVLGALSLVWFRFQSNATPAR
jgi:hypothetical protein